MNYSWLEKDMYRFPRNPDEMFCPADKMYMCPHWLALYISMQNAVLISVLERMDLIEIGFRYIDIINSDAVVKAKYEALRMDWWRGSSEMLAQCTHKYYAYLSFTEDMALWKQYNG